MLSNPFLEAEYILAYVYVYTNVDINYSGSYPPLLVVEFDEP